MEGTDNGPQILTENAPQAKRGRTGHEEDGGEKEQGMFDSLARWKRSSNKEPDLIGSGNSSASWDGQSVTDGLCGSVHDERLAPIVTAAPGHEGTAEENTGPYWRK